MADDEAAVQEQDQAQHEDDQKSEEAQKAQQKEEERESAKQKIEEIQEDPPKDLEDWPDDAAKYETFGGPEGEHSYDEGPEKKLGPSSLRHREDGGVEIEGEKVDEPDKYKGDPIPGGPTDPDAPQDLTTQKIRGEQGRELESEGDEGEQEREGDDQ